MVKTLPPALTTTTLPPGSLRIHQDRQALPKGRGHLQDTHAAHARGPGPGQQGRGYSEGHMHTHTRSAQHWGGGGVPAPDLRSARGQDGTPAQRQG